MFFATIPWLSRKSAIWIDTEYVDTDIPDTYYAPNMTAIIVSVHKLRRCIEEGLELSSKMDPAIMIHHTDEWGYIYLREMLYDTLREKYLFFWNSLMALPLFGTQ